MGLFGKSKDNDRERKAVKRKVDKLMKQYDKEKISGAEYAQGIFNLFDSSQKKKKK